jgi:hypothetical protein
VDRYKRFVSSLALVAKFEFLWPLRFYSVLRAFSVNSVWYENGVTI